MLENMVHTIKNLVVCCVCSDGEERVVSMRVSIFRSNFPWKAHRSLGLVNQKNGKGLLVRASP